MKIELIEERENPLFSRKEIHFELEADSVPSHEEVKKIISEKFSFNPILMRIKLIKGKFGRSVFDIFIDLYNSEKELNRIVRKTKQELDKEKKELEEKIKSEAEQKKNEEKPVEENKEKSE